MGQLYRFAIHGSGQTTDGVTPVTIVSVDLAAFPGVGSIDGCGIQATLTLVGKDTGNNVVTGQFSRPLKRISGTVSSLASLLSVIAFSGDVVGAPVATIDQSGTVIRGRVTGVAATTINWDGYLELWSSGYTG